MQAGVELADPKKTEASVPQRWKLWRQRRRRYPHAGRRVPIDAQPDYSLPSDAETAEIVT